MKGFLCFKSHYVFSAVLITHLSDVMTTRSVYSSEMNKKLLSITLITLLSSSNGFAASIGQYDLDGNGLDNISGSGAPSLAIASMEDRFGIPNSAVSLNGSTSIIQPLDVGITDASQGFSLSLWFKQNTSGLGKLISNKKNLLGHTLNGENLLGHTLNHSDYLNP